MRKGVQPISGRPPVRIDPGLQRSRAANASRLTPASNKCLIGAMTQRTRTGGKAPAAAESFDRRREIVEAALDLFAQTGFNGTSVREIARAVGVNEATLYHYFPSKEAILDAIIDSFIEARPAPGDALSAPEASLAATLRHIGFGVLRQAQSVRQRKLVRLMMAEGPRLAVSGRYPFLRLMEASFAPLHALFETMMSQRQMRRVDVRFATMEFMAPLLIFSQHQHGLGGLKEEPIDPDAFVKQHVELFVRALAP